MSPAGRTTISRRLVLQLAAGSAAGGLPLGAAGAAFGSGDPPALLDAYRRMRYSAGADVTFWWMRATKYGLVDHQLTPVFGMEIGNFARTRTLASGGFAATALEMVFFTDLDTGERVDAIKNPYTGERIERPDSLVGPATIEYTVSGARYPPMLPGVKLEVNPSISMFAVEGDDVWLRDDNSTQVTAAETGAPQFRVTDWATYRCALSALSPGGPDSVPTDVSFNSVSSWTGWMNMGSRPGAMVSRGGGRKYPRFDAMPARFRRILQQRYPDLARDPAAALDRPPFSFAP